MTPLRIVRGTADDLPGVMRVMQAAFDPRFGEAWTAPQCLGMLAMPGSLCLVASDGEVSGFALARMLAGEAELMLLAVAPHRRRCGVGRALLEAVTASARAACVQSIFLEVRKGNAAEALYTSSGFAYVGRRPRYYRGNSGETFDALTYRLTLS